MSWSGPNAISIAMPLRDSFQKHVPRERFKAFHIYSWSGFLKGFGIGPQKFERRNFKEGTHKEHVLAGIKVDGQFATLLGPGKRTPPSPPKISFFLSFPKEIWILGGVRFPGAEPKWKIGKVEGHHWIQHLNITTIPMQNILFDIANAENHNTPVLLLPNPFYRCKCMLPSLLPLSLGNRADTGKQLNVIRRLVPTQVWARENKVG